jgi:putative hydrolase of the HAD superfamily
MNSVRAVLFDAGNTLMHLDYAFIGEVLQRHGYPRKSITIRTAEYEAKAIIDRHLAPEAAPPDSVEGLLWPDRQKPRPSYFQTILHHLDVPAAAARSILEELEAHNRESCLWRVIEPDTPEVLASLQQRDFTLGVISNADGRVEADLEHRGIRRHFAVVIDSHVVGVEKPQREIFDLALARLAVPPERAVYIGDVFAIDILGARRAGLHAVLLDGLGCYPGQIDCPRIRRLGELLPLLPERAAGE